MAQLDRFKTAQDRSDSGFDSALEEIRSGRKRGHWIWYIFPQLAGLGGSGMSRTYAIADGAEAEAYLRDALLSSRLLTMTTAVSEQLKAPHPVLLRTLMGSDTDARKVVSSLTLFGRVARNIQEKETHGISGELADTAEEVLGVAASQGYARCRYTIDRIRQI